MIHRYKPSLEEANAEAENLQEKGFVIKNIIPYGSQYEIEYTVSGESTWIRPKRITQSKLSVF